MGKVSGLVSVLQRLRAERTNLVEQLHHVDAALSVLSKLDGRTPYAEPRHTLSASARRRISLAQKARWAKNSKAQSAMKRPKQTLSASSRRKIAAAQRARWAKWRAQRKKAA